ncbi:MAG: MlaD family protein [Pseudomonadota bacterium]
MTDSDTAGHTPVGGGLPQPEVRRPHRWRISLVWLVPVVAALIGVGLLVRAMLSAGTVIEITFDSAEGLQPGQTEVRYKDVVVGIVRGISLTEDLEKVVVIVELDRHASRLAVDDTRFWVVRPRIDTSGISGLGTLVSGVYISLDVGKSAEPRREFVGLDNAPAVTSDREGTSYLLRSATLGSLGVGSPVYYRRIQVGRIGAYELRPDGRGVTIQIFIDAPYDGFVTANSRFWHASGIDLSVGASGVQIDTESVAAVLAGGVAFITPEEGEQAGAGTEYWLHENRVSALKPPSGPPQRVRMRFAESLRGLAIDAPVDFRGVELGKVESIALEYDAQRGQFFGDVVARVFPWRLGSAYQTLRAEGSNGDDRALLQRLVEEGLRAQLRSGNLLTGQLYIALDMTGRPHSGELPQPPPAGPLPIPTEQGSLAQLQTQIGEIVEQLSRVPFADIGKDLRATIRSADTLLERLEGELAPEAAKTLAEAQRALEAASRGVLSGDSALQQDLRQTLDELERAGRSLRNLSDYLQRHPEALLRGKGASDEPAVAPDQEERR